MGYDYALVHLHYTIPPAVALTLCYYPLSTSLAVYKILFLVAIAVISTTPWDSYLIHTQIWTYPPNAIIGPTLFRIPAEEIFFFVIQTYNTSLLYLLLSKPTFHPAYLQGQKLLLNDGRRLGLRRWSGISAIVACILAGIGMIMKSGEGLYMGLILVWAGPFVLLLWSLAYQFIIGLPLSSTLIPVVLPTLYLWIVDTLALKRGTWVIESETKLGWHLWDGLEIEEAVFFLVTNVLIVFGLIAFDNAFAILQTFPSLFPTIPTLPSPVLLVQALLIRAASYDDDRIEGLQQALVRLRAKSRSFYLASGVFQGRLRVDLVLLYSFCRVADDLVDEAGSIEEAKHWIAKLNEYLDVTYGKSYVKAERREYLISTFPTPTQAALRLLPASYLSPTPLYDLLKGFETDLHFSSSNPFPMKDEPTLQVYGAQVAGTVAESCLELVFHHTKTFTPESQRRRIVQAGGRMGIALQYVNIARDISVDALNRRVYLPTTWLKEEGMSPENIIEDPTSKKTEALRQRLLDCAFEIYDEAKGAIEQLPAEARGPMRVAVESYVEIGRVLRQPGYKIKAGRATVPKLRRLRVAWNALSHT
ncbi:MAG: hypothetical protein ALECFALPRED_002934 [Alectoria fallacina]|uniref:Bifunctional lycopene cyclase/phytoene synthase n=1 Tax=Alectoria fallacina TaxID=1903189 RepID=A0A8H3EAY8_9LECA|nr:MAG: hypothetical protein ALECFALPRED_002934 [Alectoria fallacina]